MSDFYGRGIIIKSKGYQSFSYLLEFYRDKIFQFLDFQKYLDECNEDKSLFDSLFENWKSVASYYNESFETIKTCKPDEKFIFFFTRNSVGSWEGIDIVPLEGVYDTVGVSYKFKFMIETPG